jgi:processive 1,2-diacylglycerol beta-glucosyltransferase
MRTDGTRTTPGTGRVLLLSAPAGRAHERRAEALREAGALWFPAYEFRHEDVLALMSSAVARMYAWGHRMLATHARGQHARVYRYIDGMYAREGGSRATSLARVSGGLARLASFIDAYRPCVIITTHSLATEFACEVIGRYGRSTRVWAIPTEYGFQHFEYHPGVTGYCAASDEVAWGLERRGVAPPKVHVTGVPISPAFSQPCTRAECACTFGIDRRARIVTLMAGGRGLDRLDLTATALLNGVARCHVLAVPGSNQGLRQRLLDMALHVRGRMTVAPADVRIAHVFGCTDVLVSRAGAQTVAEALMCGMATVFHSIQRGCEDGNMAFAVEHGAAWYAANLEALVFRVQRLLSDAERRALMSAKARALGRPDAARAILELVLSSP